MNSKVAIRVIGPRCPQVSGNGIVIPVTDRLYKPHYTFLFYFIHFWHLVSGNGLFVRWKILWLKDVQHFYKPGIIYGVIRLHVFPNEVAHTLA